MLTHEYPWYEIVEETDELEQGDFIDDFEVLATTYIPGETEADMPNYRVKGIARKYNVVVVSQSCDLDAGKIDYVLLCPRIKSSEYIELSKHFGANKLSGRKSEQSASDGILTPTDTAPADLETGVTRYVATNCRNVVAARNFA